MFERYTERARRAIFFARYEATQLGGDHIDTDHLLLGLLREDKVLSRRLDKGYDNFLPRVEDANRAYKKLPASADMPLSAACNHVLRNAAQEADALGHKHIGTEHLLLGLLREGNGLARKFLEERGITLESERQRLAADVATSSPAPMPREHPRAPSLDELLSRSAGPPGHWGDVIKIHGANWRKAYVESVANQYLRFAWEIRKWTPRDILVDLQTNRVLFYSGQEFDPAKFELKQGGWTNDHCVVCRWELTQSDDPQHGLGYTNGRDWLCTECYDNFFQPPITPLHDLYT